MKLSEIGEFELIERMAAIFQETSAVAAEVEAALSRLSTGIGDDAAVWRPLPDRLTIATADAMVEGIHFTVRTTDWYDLGWKAMASNLSDVAGMGGIPKYALMVLAAPADRRVEEVEALCRGMADVAGRFGAVVVGGDTVASPVTTVTITLLGETLESSDPATLPVLSRFAAKPGDSIAVTGRLGASAGGLELLLRGGTTPTRFGPLVEAHRRPFPRVNEGQLLVNAGVRCGMDLSDGLLGDLARICRASHVSAAVELAAVPVAPLLQDAVGDRAIDLALSGGEDYELLCAAPAETMERARLLLRSAGSELTVVGKLRGPAAGAPPVVLVGSEGREFVPSRSGWEHFR